MLDVVVTLVLSSSVVVACVTFAFLSKTAVLNVT